MGARCRAVIEGEWASVEFMITYARKVCREANEATTMEKRAPSARSLQPVCSLHLIWVGSSLTLMGESSRRMAQDWAWLVKLR